MFDALSDDETLHNALNNHITDNHSLIQVLANRTSCQRMAISNCYKTSYDKDLINDIKLNTSGNFGRILIALLTPPAEFYARELYNAITGVGTDENALIDIMCSVTNDERLEISIAYERMFEESLIKALKGERSGDFRRLMMTLSVVDRDESGTINYGTARYDAHELKNAGIDKVGTNEMVFIRILCTNSYEQITLIDEEYTKLLWNKKQRRSLKKDIISEFSGSIKDGLLAILSISHDPAMFFAEKLHKSMSGFRTNHNALIRLIVARCEIDMDSIKKEFELKYGKSLKSAIKDNASGDYRDLLFALIGEDYKSSV